MTPASVIVILEVPSEDFMATLSVPPEPCSIVESEAFTVNTVCDVPPLFLIFNSSEFCRTTFPETSKEPAIGASTLIPTAVNDVSTKRTFEAAPLIIKSSDTSTLPVTSRASVGVALLIPTLSVVELTYRVSVSTFRSADIFVSPTTSNLTAGVDVPIPTLLLVVSTTKSEVFTSTLPVRVILLSSPEVVILLRRSVTSFVFLLQTSKVFVISVLANDATLFSYQLS